MPGLLRKHANSHSSCSSSPSSSTSSTSSSDCNGIWSCSKKDLTYAHLNKFWSELPSSARRKLLCIDKQALFEQVRKNLYCSRCNGLLLEGFSQMVVYGKSVQQESAPGHNAGVLGQNKKLPDIGSKLSVGNAGDDVRDPSVHPWGGLAATRDSMLTLMDCFLEGTPLEVLQNVFDSARGRERDRELLYPDACGGGGRGWISQGSCNSGRGHGMKETCALHTARISCEALIDFWSALSEDTCQSLLRMKEEDFLEKLMFRFDSKRFCRDCRRNVVREFKELKELKRTRRETHCNEWFCAADTTFQYEVSDNTVQADWHEFVAEAGGAFQHVEWALGTEEGKSDILEFEDVGLCESVVADGLELGNITACFITLRVWKHDGRYTEFSVKAHALKGRLCVHRRLIAGDGYVTITKGESIKSFFEHAEEIEEEEDEDFIDKDGSELDGEGSQLQKHAKSPELARDFLLDAATVIFKEQVEKAFREGTARQNAHSIFVCLALSLLEERVHVACKEITTLEKQNKLLEEEEDEKREEEERRERKRLKDKERKLRRKQKLKGKEQEKGRNSVESIPVDATSQGSVNVTDLIAEEEQLCCSNASDIQNVKDNSILSRSPSPDMEEVGPPMDGMIFENGNCQCHDMSLSVDEMDGAFGKRDGNGAFIMEHSKSSRRKAKLRKGPMLDMGSKQNSWKGPVTSIETNGHGLRSFGQVASSSFAENSFMSVHGLRKHSKNALKYDHLWKTDHRGNPVKWNENSHWSAGRSNSRYDYQHCGCGSLQSNIKLKTGDESPMESRIADRPGVSINLSNPVYKIDNPITEPIAGSCGVSKGRLQAGLVSGVIEERVYPKRGWEHLESHQPYRDSGSVRRDTSGGTPPPCTFGTVPSSCNNDGKIFDTCSNGWAGSSSSVSSENEKDYNISNSDHAESNARECGMPSQCHVQQMNSATIQQATDGSLARNTIKSRSLNVAGSDASSTSSSDANGFILGHSSSKISKKEGVNSIAGLSGHGQQYVNQLISGVQHETTLNVCDDLGNVQGIDTVRETYKCECVSSTTTNDSEDMPQLKEHFTGHVNGVVLPIEKSTLPAGQVTPQHQMSAINVSNLSSPLFPLHCQPNPGYYQIRRARSPLSANGLLPCSQPNKVLFPGSAGFGLSASGLPPLSMPYPCLQALPPVFGARHMPSLPLAPNYVPFNEFTEFSRVGEVLTAEVGCSVEATFHQQEIKHPHEEQDSTCIYLSECSFQQKPSSNLPAHGTSGFSLFHFDSPSAVPLEEQDSNSRLLEGGRMGENHIISNGNCALQQHAVAMSKDQPPIQEYSLFAASHGNRFGFF